jgi:DNA-binding LacI/PurR family transcriptional regulator
MRSDYVKRKRLCYRFTENACTELKTMTGSAPETGESAYVRPTIKMIAGIAKVSISTVSRSLSDDPSISKATKRRIAAIAQELGFVPNIVARGLVQRRTNLVGFILGPFTNPFYLEMLPLLASRLADRGAQMMVFRIKDPGAFEGTLSALAQHQVQGCLIAAATLTPEAAELCKRFRMPVVMINRIGDFYASSINCNNREAGEQVAAALIGEGRTRLAYIGGPVGQATVQDIEREQGFWAKAQALGIPAGRRFEGAYGYSGGRDATDRMLNEDATIDGVFVANDIMAFGVLDRLRSANMPVPDRISVIGFDDLPASSWDAYNLTTVRQPVETMIDRACDLLDAHVRNPAMPAESTFLRGELIVRGSTRLQG